MEEDVRLFSVTHTLSRPLNDYEEYEHLMWIPGEIVEVHEDSSTTLAGRTSVCLVDYARAKFEHGLTLHGVLDADMIAYSYAPGLLGDDGDLNKKFDDMLFVERILIVDRIEVLPKFRGRCLGIWAMYSILDCFATSNVLPVIKPYPLQFGPSFNSSSEGDLKLSDFRISRPEAFRKIRNYWSQVGFKKVWGDGDEQLWVLDPTRQHPDRKDVLGDFYDP
jgi:hypothetical protein